MTDGLRVLSLPLSATDDRWVTLYGPFPISRREWERLLHILHTMEPGLVSAEAPSEAAESPDAR